jgi:hypothetical protein
MWAAQLAEQQARQPVPEAFAGLVEGEEDALRLQARHRRFQQEGARVEHHPCPFPPMKVQDPLSHRSLLRLRCRRIRRDRQTQRATEACEERGSNQAAESH